MTMVRNSVTTSAGQVTYGEKGRGRPLVILHSLLTDSRAFHSVVPDLPGRIITLDLPGFGGTDRVASGIEGFADLMAAAVRRLCSDEPPTVMGNGLGSFVALAMAIRHPEAVDRLVLVGSGATFPEEARPAFANMASLVESDGMAAAAPVALRRIFTEDYLTRHPEQAEERTRVLAGTNPEAFITACRALEQVDLTERVGGITASTLIVVGSDDQATPPELARRLHDLLPDSRLVVLPGVAHAPQLQDPTGFVEAVQRFLEEDG